MPLSQEWKERLQDGEKLTEYAKSHALEIKNASLEKLRMENTNITNGLFENTTWKDITAKNIKLSKTVIRHSLIEKIDFSESIMSDVTFEEVDLKGVRFYHATLTNVRFINCSLNGVNIDQAKNSQITISDSDVISTSFSEGQLIALFKKTKIYKGVELTDLQPPSSLTFEKSELDEVNMDRSKLKELKIEETLFDGVLKVGSVDNLVIQNSTVDTSFSETTIGTLMVDKSTIKKMIFNGSKINAFNISNCNSFNDMGMFESHIETINIAKCKLNNFRPREAMIGSLNVIDSSILDSKFENMKVKSIIFNNVSLGGELNFTGAQVRDLKTQNVTKQPGLKLITDGSNIHF